MLTAWRYTAVHPPGMSRALISLRSRERLCGGGGSKGWTMATSRPVSFSEVVFNFFRSGLQFQKSSSMIFRSRLQ